MPESPADEPSRSAADPGVSASLGLDSIWRACESTIRGDEPDPLLGRDLGGVTLVRVIAEGGMGRVYEGRQRQPSRAVAAKVMRPGLLSRVRLLRFLKELEILGSLQHPGISQIFAAGTYDVDGMQLPYFIMELVPDALPITEFVRREPIPAAPLRLFLDACDAVGHGHAQGVVHRDIKPRNILVDGDGRVKVIDFGVARATTDDAVATSLTTVGQLVGTLQYMPPERVTGGAAEAGPEGDVYALGLVLHEVLAGGLPYDVAGLGLVDAARVISARPVPRRSEAARRVPGPLWAIVQRCLDIDPRRRFADATALAAAIRAADDAVPDRRTVGRRGAAVAIAAVAVVACLAWMGGPARRVVEADAGLDVAAAGGEAGPAAGVPAASDSPEVLASPLPVLAAADADGVVRYSFHTVKDAEPYVVRKVNVRLYEEATKPPLMYWGTALNDVVGFVELRFEFPGTVSTATLSIGLQCWDFVADPSGGVGRGAAAIEVSADGRRWVPLIDDITERKWGTWHANAVLDLPPDVCGGDAVWVRCRVLTELSANEDYCTAQIGRQEYQSANPRPALSVTAVLAE